MLKAFLSYEYFEKYYEGINKDFIEANYPDLYRVWVSLETLHKGKNNKTYTFHDLRAVLLTLFPKITDAQDYDCFFNEAEQINVDPEILVMLCKELARRESLVKIAREALKGADGLTAHDTVTATVKEHLDIIDKVNQDSETDTENDEHIVTDDLAGIFKTTYLKPGLRWKLDSLNKAMGSLRKGDFGLIYARPEGGKTTFIASQVTHMATQLTEEDGPILWFNNEEMGNKVKLRCVQATLELTTEQVGTDVEHSQKEYLELTHGKILIYDEALLSRKDVEHVCQRYKPSLIIFDQLDKIYGFSSDRYDLELKAIYGWARELAKKYGPVIGVCQAASTGEGKRYLDMNDIDNSKVGKQGECDWILGIGSTHEYDNEFIRYFHLSKNKLLGDPDTDPKMRHGRWQVRIVPEIASYTDFIN